VDSAHTPLEGAYLRASAEWFDSEERSRVRDSLHLLESRTFRAGWNSAISAVLVVLAQSERGTGSCLTRSGENPHSGTIP
jgi:hypothetical protein